MIETLAVNGLPRISAHALRTRDRCRRMAALEHGLRLPWPGPVPEPGSGARAGQRFHRLVQQHRLGIPVDPGDDADLWERFLRSPYSEPAGMPGSIPAERHVFTEQTLQFGFAGAPFHVRFDEVRRDARGWTVVDWKTGPLNEATAAGDWQTRLYRFALAQAGDALSGGEPIPASRIKMVYWLVRLEKALVFPYDEAAFEADRACFEAIAGSAGRAPADLPGPDDPGACRTCRFESLCHPGTPETPRPPALILPAFEL